MSSHIPAAFDAARYIAANPDIFAAGVNTADAAWRHYIDHGAAESLQGAASRAPAPWFDAAWYLGQHPDLAAAGLSPPDLFIHFLTWGLAEGRLPKAGHRLTQDERIAVQADYTLTPGHDDLTGSAGDDTFHAPLAMLDNTHTGTLQPGDRIDGGAGFDTLVAQLAGNVVAPRLDSVEHIQLSAYYPSTLQAAHIQGLQQLSIGQTFAALAVQQLPNLVSLDLSDIAAVQAGGQANHITLGYQPQALAGHSVQTITLDNVQLQPGGAKLYLDADGPATLDVLDITVARASTLAGIEGAPKIGLPAASGILHGTHRVQITAHESVDLGLLAAPNLQQLDAGPSRAGVSVDLSQVASPHLFIQGGAGDDSFVLGAQATQLVHVVTGGGHDTLVLQGLAVTDAPVVLHGPHTAADADAALAARLSAPDPVLVYWQDAGGQVWLGLDDNGGQDDNGAGIQLLAGIDDLAISQIAGGITLIY
ncbi:hypothetical protein ACMHYJ_10765 [Castellaniella hirudinis]|uniref:hypothetical protein n=1 Tax=Castellaniella hirudinis TaxID=1144617 RepID=UPI0039C09B15